MRGKENRATLAYGSTFQNESVFNEFDMPCVGAALKQEGLPGRQRWLGRSGASGDDAVAAGRKPMQYAPMIAFMLVPGRRRIRCCMRLLAIRHSPFAISQSMSMAIGTCQTYNMASISLQGTSRPMPPSKAAIVASASIQAYRCRATFMMNCQGLLSGSPILGQFWGHSLPEEGQRHGGIGLLLFPPRSRYDVQDKSRLL